MPVRRNRPQREGTDKPSSCPPPSPLPTNPRGDGNRVEEERGAGSAR